jgi:hypothetical protein
MAETNQLVMTRTRRRELKKEQKEAAKKRAKRKKEGSKLGITSLNPHFAGIYTGIRYGFLSTWRKKCPY